MTSDKDDNEIMNDPVIDEEDSGDVDFTLDISEDFFDDVEKDNEDPEEDFKSISFDIGGIRFEENHNEEENEAVPEVSISEENGEPDITEEPAHADLAEDEASEEEFTLEDLMEDEASEEEPAPADLMEDETESEETSEEEPAPADIAEGEDLSGEAPEEMPSEEEPSAAESAEDADLSDEAVEEEYDLEGPDEAAEEIPSESADEAENGSQEGENAAEDGETEYSEADFFEFVEDPSIEVSQGDEAGEDRESEGKKHNYVPLKVFLSIVVAFVIFSMWLLFSDTGRTFIAGMASKFIYNSMKTSKTSAHELTADGDIVTISYIDDDGNVVIDEQLTADAVAAASSQTAAAKPPRSEDYVKTFLLFGIESINEGENTDALMLVSINTKDNTIKLTSILRDTWVSIPGWVDNKINAAFVCGEKGASESLSRSERRAYGALLLEKVIENTFDVDISGYAYVDFSAFENIIDRIGGIDLELGADEVRYLNRTNYISDYSNHTLVNGWNHMNGNQVLGYVRVRKVPTLGGADADFGRTERQQKVISAIINQYMSLSFFDMINVMTDCLGYIHTDVTEAQIRDVLKTVWDNSIFKISKTRLPYDGMFRDVGLDGIYNGRKNITYALVMEGNEEKVIKKYHKFLFLDE